MGTLTVYSAGRGTNQSSLWLKQSIWNLIGFSIMSIAATINPLRIFRSAFFLYIFGIISLITVLLIGHTISGSQRWIVIGRMTWQPSEIMKWLTLLFVAHRLGDKALHEITTWEMARASILVFLPMLLVMKQPDLGMTISFLPILLIVPLTKGLKARWVLAGMLVVVLVSVFSWQKVLKPYQKQRVITFLDPGADLHGKGYQINQSRIAIGAGGLFGQGFTSGSQTQLNFLPVKTTDFIFSVWAEERGFLGVLLALGLFGSVIMYIFNTARAAKTYSEAYFCVGAAGIIALHLVVSVGMVIGLLPNKGIVLPFFSAGGSSTVSYFLGLGTVMAIRHRAKIK
jgi:rod shape determining protein RodA